MKITKEFEKEIAPFFWVEHEESASVFLNVGEYLQEIFDTREDEGFEGSGYEMCIRDRSSPSAGRTVNNCCSPH